MNSTQALAFGVCSGALATARRTVLKTAPKVGTGSCAALQLVRLQVIKRQLDPCRRVLVWDEAENMSAHLGDTGTRAFEVGDGQVTPPCPSGGVESADCESEGAEPSSQIRQASCYPPVIRRLTTLVHRPSSPAHPPRPATVPSDAGVQPRGVDNRLPDTGEGYVPRGVSVSRGG